MRSSTLWRTYSSSKRSGPFSGPFGTEDDGVLRAGAADEAHVAQLAFVGLVAEGAGGGDGGAVGFGGQVDAGFLLADGSGKVDGVLNAVAGAGIDADELVALAHFDGLEDADVLAAAALGADADAEKGST